jgi:2-dehydro-3-deoxygluconokinase
MILDVAPKQGCRWDLVALGEVMLRLDPGETRIATARTFRAWEGGGEYNVARSLKRSFELDTTVVTALVDNPVGRLIQDLIYQGGVDQSHIGWLAFDGVGRRARNGLNFTERGFGLRAPLGCSDRGHTAASQLSPGRIDWDRIFGLERARWFHTGGIFAGLSETTQLVAKEAMEAAHRYGTIVSYDLNYRESLWRDLGGKAGAQSVNRALMPLVDVLLGNEEDFTAALGFEVEGVGPDYADLKSESFARMVERVVAEFPSLRIVATSLRGVKSATRNDWSGICFARGQLFEGRTYEDLEVLDRVGGGDSFAAGLIFGLLTGRDVQEALELGVAHGALAMTTPGDTSMATLAEVDRVVSGGSARVLR